MRLRIGGCAHLMGTGPIKIVARARRGWWQVTPPEGGPTQTVKSRQLRANRCRPRPALG